MSTFEELICQVVPLGKPSSTGWRGVKCASCNDYKERGAFNFSNGSTIYNCFNCGLTTGFDVNSHKSVSNKFKKLLIDFGIDEQQISISSGKEFLSSKEIVNIPKPQWVLPKEIDSSHLTLLSKSNSEWVPLIIEYLNRRGLTENSYSFMISDQEKLMGRLIIPYYLRSKLVYYQARSIDDTIIKPRYLNANSEKNLLFNHQEIYSGIHNTPLYVTEGALDSISIGPAIGLTDSHINGWKYQELQKASKSRHLVFVIDKNQNGYQVGKFALENNWDIIVMPDDLEDANQALIRFGKLWLLNYLSSNRANGIAGEVLIRMKCKQ